MQVEARETLAKEANPGRIVRSRGGVRKERSAGQIGKAARLGQPQLSTGDGPRLEGARTVVRSPGVVNRFMHFISNLSRI